MEAKALTPRELFDGTVCYEIPPFQRPYVWTEEDQWQPLWDDVERLVDRVLAAPDEAARGTVSHFLGAVVVQYLSPLSPDDPSRWSVIDGQQRLTTLQILLDAAQLVIETDLGEDDSESLQEVLTNRGARFRGTPKRFKLVPSRLDLDVFDAVMDNGAEVRPEQADHQIALAHEFFSSEIRRWSGSAGSEQIRRERLLTLSRALQHHLRLVSISLDSNDDDHLIFETLNDRGTPLLAADLVKNFVFQGAQNAGADVDVWLEKYWDDFDDSWWRSEITQGRYRRARIDVFLQYWLTMRLRDDVLVDAVFARFKEHAATKLSDATDGEVLLAELRRDADTFRELAQLDADTAAGSFYQRVVEILELGAFIPLLLWLISPNHQVEPAESDRALAALESWAIRRMLMRLTTKGIARTAIALIKVAETAPDGKVGQAVADYLMAQTADTGTWPADVDITSSLPAAKVYSNIKQSRLQEVLRAVELHLRSERHEQVTMPGRLEVEHVMPRSWGKYWGAGVTGEEATARRNQLVNSIGNLTLVTGHLNGSLSNRPWTDDEAATAGFNGQQAGRGKMSLLSGYSLLVLNKQIVDGNPDEWTEEAIEARGRSIAEAITAVWPRG